MKKILAIALFLQIILSVTGQEISVPNRYELDEHPFHFGFCLGLNMMDFIIKPKSDTLVADVSAPNIGFHIQIVTNLRLGEYFDLRFLPGIAFNQRNLNFFKKDKTLDGASQQIESNFLEFPLLLKYKAKRLKNVRPYVITGANCRVDLAKSFNQVQGIYIALKRVDLYYEAGTGVDFYLPYFKLSTEIKYSLGFRNILNHRTADSAANERFENSIDKLKSSVLMLSFCFE